MTVESFKPEAVQIDLTDAAIAHVQQAMQKQPGTGALRLFITKTGCSGYSYQSSLVAEPEADDVVAQTRAPFVVYLQQSSVPALNGSTLDLQQKALGQSQLVFDNPNETGRCGCGESFTTKDVGPAWK